jgi:hypothetical protein
MTSRRQQAFALLVSVAIAAVMVTAFLTTPSWMAEPAGDAEDFETLAEALFTTEVMAFLALGVLLTAAMIGAMIIARPLGAEDDASHYHRRDRHEVDDEAHVADVEGHLADEDGSGTAAKAAGAGLASASLLDGGEEE